MTDARRLHPPADEVPATVAVDAPLVSLADLAIHLPRFDVYRHGVDLPLVVRQRGAGPTIPFWRGAGGPDIAVVLADGRRIVPGDGATRSAVSGDVVLRRRVSGTGAVCEIACWLSPIPTERWRLTVAWPERGIAEAGLDVAPGPLREASARAADAFGSPS